MRRGVGLALLLVVALLASGCGGGAKAPSQPAASTQAAPAAQAGEGGEITIVAKDNVFEPAAIEIKAGQTYEFKIENRGAAVHNFLIQGTSPTIMGDAIVAAGSDDEVKVRLDQPGTYTYQCAYHPEMKGQLTVSR